MIISVFASIWSQNLWDELILKNEIKALEKEYGKDTIFKVFSYDAKNPFFKKKNIEYIEYFPINIKNPKNIFRNIKNFLLFIKTVSCSDLVVVWWGGIIYDVEKQSVSTPLKQWLFRTNIFRILRKKIYFYALWLSIKNKDNHKEVKKIFSWAYKITLRDKYSHNLLKNLWIESTIVMDPVFGEVEDHPLTPSLVRRGDNPEEKYLIKKVKAEKFWIADLEDIDLEWKKIALALRSWYIDSDPVKEEEKIIEIIDYLLEKKAKVILLPHSFHKTDDLANDFKFLNKFLRINEPVLIVDSMEDVYTKYIYKEFDLCLAMRLHSMILSQVYSIPFVAISYSTKTDEVFK